MHHDYVDLLPGVASLFVLVASVARAVTMEDEKRLLASERSQGIRERLSGRYRAHPAAFRLQVVCLAVGAALLVVSGLMIVGH